MKNIKNFITEDTAQASMFVDGKEQRLNEGLWEAIERDNYQTYDMFVGFIKDFYAPTDNKKAYEIEDVVNEWMSKMMEDLDFKYGSKS